MKENNYYVINLESVKIPRNHPYTLEFKGYIPVYGSSNKLYTFEFDGNIQRTDASIPEEVKEDFANQLSEDYGCGDMFDIKAVRKQFAQKKQYRMKM